MPVLKSGKYYLDVRIDGTVYTYPPYPPESDWSAKHIDGNTYTLQDSSGLYLAVAPDETVITSDQPFNWDITWVGTDGPWRITPNWIASGAFTATVTPGSMAVAIENFKASDGQLWFFRPRA